jgi:hypothetical protein
MEALHAAGLSARSALELLSDRSHVDRVDVKQDHGRGPGQSPRPGRRHDRHHVDPGKTIGATLTSST